MTAKADFNITSGTFSHNSGTLLFEGADTRYFNVPFQSPIFYNVNINKDHNSKLIIEIGDSLKVENNLIANNGKFQFNQVFVEGDIQINSDWDGGSS